jgi:ABC-type sugar transport system ATPase subunit
MITLRDFTPRGGGGPYTLEVPEGQVLGLLCAGGGEAQAFLEAVAGGRRHGGTVQLSGGPRTARDVAYAPDEPEQILFGRTGRDALRSARAWEALDALGRPDLLDRDFLALSSGERRRLALAAVLGSGRSLLLFDRPTAGLDPEGQTQFWEALRRIGSSAIVAALDEREALRCDLLLTLPGSGPAQAVGDFLPAPVCRSAGWPPSEVAQIAWALLGIDAVDLASVRREVEVRCGPKHQA